MSGKMEKSVSSETLCNSVSTGDMKQAEKIFSSAILPPLYLVAAFLVLLRFMSKSLYAEVVAKPEVDPFKSVWLSGPAVFTVLYLIMVFGGMRWMKNREEFQIKPYIFTYNLYQCILNVWCVLAMAHEIYTNPHFTGMWGNVPQRGVAGFRISFLVWVHYNNKYVELLDTLWMILRKKNNQVSFLHCYHHILLIWAWYYVCTIEAGGDCYFGAMVNSFIHVIMYGYYTLALLNVPCPWKRWITNCQMLQFCLCLAHSCYVVYKGNMPIELPLAQAFVMINMLVLFGNFYVKSYLNKKKPAGEEKKKA
jgi:elongation of very long chain fatty acids protein 4